MAQKEFGPVGASVDIGDVTINNPPGNPVPVSDAGGSLTVDDAAGPISVDDNGGSLTIDDAAGPISVDDNGGSLTVDSPQLPSSLTPSGNIRASLQEIASVVSTVNSTSIPLGSNATFTGTAEDISRFAVVTVFVFTDQASAADGLKAQYSIDGTNWDDDDKFTIPANNGKFFSLPPEAQYFRIVYTNGPVAQSIFRLQTKYHPLNVKPSSHSIRSSLVDDDDAELVRAILSGKISGTNSYINVETTSDGRLKVAQEPPAAPTGTTAVSNTYDGTISANTSVDSFYVIPNGQQLTIQSFNGGGASAANGGSIEMFYDPNGNLSVLTTISVAFIPDAGGNFSFDLKNQFVGDGTRRIVTRRTRLGGISGRMFASWFGYLE